MLIRTGCLCWSEKCIRHRCSALRNDLSQSILSNELIKCDPSLGQLLLIIDPQWLRNCRKMQSMSDFSLRVAHNERQIIRTKYKSIELTESAISTQFYWWRLVPWRGSFTFTCGWPETSWCRRIETTTGPLRDTPIWATHSGKWFIIEFGPLARIKADTTVCPDGNAV